LHAAWWFAKTSHRKFLLSNALQAKSLLLWLSLWSYQNKVTQACWSACKFQICHSWEATKIHLAIATFQTGYLEIGVGQRSQQNGPFSFLRTQVKTFSVHTTLSCKHADRRQPAVAHGSSPEVGICALVTRRGTELTNRKQCEIGKRRYQPQLARKQGRLIVSGDVLYTRATMQSVLQLVITGWHLTVPQQWADRYWGMFSRRTHVLHSRLGSLETARLRIRQMPVIGTLHLHALVVPRRISVLTKAS